MSRRLAMNTMSDEEEAKNYDRMIASGQISDPDALTNQAIERQGVGAESIKQNRASQAVMGQGSGNTDTAGSLMMASGNSVGMGIGAGLKVIAMKDAKDQARANMEYQAKNQRLERQQQALNKLVDIGNGLRRL